MSIKHGHVKGQNIFTASEVYTGTGTDNTTSWGKPYTRLPSLGHVKMAYRCSKFNAYCLFSC